MSSVVTRITSRLTAFDTRPVKAVLGPHLGMSLMKPALAGDARALTDLAYVLRKRTQDVDARLVKAAEAIEGYVKRGAIPLAIAEVRKIQPLLTAIEH